MTRAVLGGGRWVVVGGALLLAACGSEVSVPPPAPVAPAPANARATGADGHNERAPAPVPPRAWRPARVLADAPLLAARTVTIAPGDTLDGIARASGASVGALAAANGLAVPYGLVPGSTLTIPAGRWHVVKPGETGIAIARAYKAAFVVVARANGLKPPYALEVGDRLLIPVPVRRPTARALPAPRTPEAEAAPVPATVEGRAQAYNLDIEKLLRGEPQAPARAARPHTPPPLRGSPPRSGEDRPAPERAAGSPTGPGVEGVAQAEPAVSAIHLDWPLTGRLLSTFGAKSGGRFNDGINIAAAEGSPVKAAAEGRVIYAGNGVAAFGGLILIRHERGWLTAYAHCSALLVTKGDRVTRGQTIARAGATGEVDTPQLHFEVRRGRTPVDPVRLLPAREG